MTADVEFLRDLVLAPGPSGFEQPVQEVVRRRVAGIAEPVTDVLGNVTATLNGGVAPAIVVAGHADQIGLQVTWVNDAGYVYFDKLGGVDPLAAARPRGRRPRRNAVPSGALSASSRPT